MYSEVWIFQGRSQLLKKENGDNCPGPIAGFFISKIFHGRFDNDLMVIASAYLFGMQVLQP